MARDRVKAKGRRESGRFIQIPDAVLRSPEFQQLNGGALRVLIGMLAQYNGHNNGDLSAAAKILRLYGMRSDDTIAKGLKALLDARLVVRTREGQFMSGAGSRCALFAVTWRPVDECPGKGLTISATKTALRSFAPSTAELPVRKPEPTRSGNRSGARQTYPPPAPETGGETPSFLGSSAPETGGLLESTSGAALNVAQCH